VIAVGSPFGLQATVTAGIISAKAARSARAPSTTSPDRRRRSNPGNSGGPLVNLQGEVIASTPRSSRAVGIGFAIPSKHGRKIYTELRDKGRVVRAARRSIQPLTA